MKVCLINPPQLVPKKWAWGQGANVFQPLGIAYIAAVLEKSGYDVSILDALAPGWKQRKEIQGSKIFAGLGFEEIQSKIKEISPNVAGVTIPFSSQSSVAFEVASAIKGVSKDIITVVGGPHPTVRAEECIAQPGVDFVVVGEGEYTMLELLKHIEGDEDYDQVKGLAYKDANGVVRMTGGREYINNLDDLPFPARHLLPMEEYFKAAGAGKTSRNMPHRWATIITSRGCPYNCVFCSVHAAMGRRWRYRNPENVVQEIEELVDRWGVKYVDFEDDNLTFNKDRIRRICQLIVERGLPIVWETPNGVRADTFDEELLRLMKESGCHRLYLSPESGDQWVVDNIINKKLDLGKVEEVVRLCKKVGIKVTCSFVIGLIGETKENIRKTIEFSRRLRELGADRFGFNIATPYYGSRLHELAKEKGYLVKEFDSSLLSTSEALIETPEFKPYELSQLKEEAQAINFRLSIDNLKVALRNPYLVWRAFVSLLNIAGRKLCKAKGSK